MAFKTDRSFLRFLTMGAIGVRETARTLRDEGFKPIELERYCTSNKIWMTKVKRLRLPDLLCVRTGVRFEVRAKSALKVRMSDAPANPDRRWDVGLRDNDLVAFIARPSNGAGVAALSGIDSKAGHPSSLGCSRGSLLLTTCVGRSGIPLPAWRRRMMLIDTRRRRPCHTSLVPNDTRQGSLTSPGQRAMGASRWSSPLPLHDWAIAAASTLSRVSSTKRIGLISEWRPC